MASSPIRRKTQGDTAISINPATPVIPGPGPRRLENGLGLAYMAGGLFLFSAVDACSKYLTLTLPPLEIAWARQLGLLLGALILLGLRGGAILRTRHPGLQIARGAMAAGSATLFIAALAFVPLVDAMAVAFVAPFLVTVLGALILREPVGIRRWSAITIGFIGAMIIIRPGFV